MRAAEFLGDATIEKMKKTKWYVLARFIDQLIYDGRVELRDPKNEHSKCFRTSAKPYIGQDTVPTWIKVPGHEGAYIEVEQGLREVMHELERMAVKEVT